MRRQPHAVGCICVEWTAGAPLSEGRLPVPVFGKWQANSGRRLPVRFARVGPPARTARTSNRQPFGDSVELNGPGHLRSAANPAARACRKFRRRAAPRPVPLVAAAAAGSLREVDAAEPRSERSGLPESAPACGSNSLSGPGNAGRLRCSTGPTSRHDTLHAATLRTRPIGRANGSVRSRELVQKLRPGRCIRQVVSTHLSYESRRARIDVSLTT